MKKFVFVNRYFAPDHSASSQMLSDLAFSIARCGGTVHVITSRQRYDDPDARLPAKERLAGVIVHRVWTSSFGRHDLTGRAIDYLTFAVSTTLLLILLLRRGDAVIAKTDPPLISVVCAFCALLRRAKVVNWLQDLFPEVVIALGSRVLSARAARILLRIRDWSLRRAAMNVVIGELMRDRLIDRGIDATCIRMIPNWADGEKIRPLSRSECKLRREWALNDQFVVSYSGNLGRAHDCETILAAAELLREESRIVFLIIGDGAKSASFREEVSRRHLTNIIFKPYQPRDQLGAALAVGDAHLVSLLPAVEGLMVPSKFYGIAAAGRPALFIGLASGEIGRIVLAERCGEVVKPGDADALVAAIERLAADPAVSAASGERARQIFELRYQAPQALAQWQSLLRSIVAIRPPRAVGLEVRPVEPDSQLSRERV